MIGYKITNYHIDPPNLTIDKPIKALVNIQADLTITDTKGVFFQGDMFTVVELADKLREWIVRPQEDFNFESMDEEALELLVFRHLESGCEVYSSWQQKPFSGVVTQQELVKFAEDFIATVVNNTQAAFGVNLQKLIGL